MNNQPKTTQISSKLLDLGMQEFPQIFGGITQQESEALTLLAAVHEGRDSTIWAGLGYWDQLLERAKLSRISGPTLKDWWNKISQDMDVVLYENNRQAVTEILTENSPQVLETITNDTEYLVSSLLRLCADTRNKNYKKTNSSDIQGELL